jgi:hypothetical protein
MRSQLVKLQEDVPSRERVQIDDAIDDFLDQPSSWQAVEYKKVLWLCGNALRSKLAQLPQVEAIFGAALDEIALAIDQRAASERWAFGSPM